MVLKRFPQIKQPLHVSALFFFRRRPRWRGMPRDWKMPDNAEDFQKMVEASDFISANLWTTHDKAKYPIISLDLGDLEQHLLPVFFKFSQKSKYYQNLFYLYQWIFVWGAFLTTVFGTLTVYASAHGNTTGNIDILSVQKDILNIQNGLQNIIDWPQLLGYVTAVIGALTAFFTAVSNRNDPQKRWARTRRLAEELRIHYFKYLSHVSPYDNVDRLQKMRENVVASQAKE